MQIRATGRAITGMLFLILAATQPHALASSPAQLEQRVYSVGIVPQFEVKRLHQIWQPILQQLEQRTGARFRLTGSPTIAAFEKEILAGRFDFAYMNPYHIILVQQRNEGYLPLVKDVGRELRGILVVKKGETNIEMDELAGKPVAFPDTNALGTTLMIKQALEDKFNISIDPRYVKTHDSVYLNVALGRVAAGGGVQKTFDRQNPELRALLQVIYTTSGVTPHPFAVHPRVNRQLAEAVKQALLAMGKETTGRELLAAIPVEKIGPASLADYAPLTDMNLQRYAVEPR